MQRLLPSVPRKIRGYTYSRQVLGPTLLWVEDKGEKLFKNIPHLSADNKLRQFSFELLHCVLVTNQRLTEPAHG